MLACLAFTAWPRAASANPFFQQQTGLPCSSCHISGQENQGEQGLNPFGQAFKHCGFKLGCAAPPAPSQPHTTQFFNGLANFHNTCNGQQRWVGIRVRKNDDDRTMGLVIDPGQSVTVAVPIGSTWAASCGAAPQGNTTFHYIALDTVVAN